MLCCSWLSMGEKDSVVLVGSVALRSSVIDPDAMDVVMEVQAFLRFHRRSSGDCCRACCLQVCLL